MTGRSPLPYCEREGEISCGKCRAFHMKRKESRCVAAGIATPGYRIHSEQRIAPAAEFRSVSVSLTVAQKIYSTQNRITVGRSVAFGHWEKCAIKLRLRLSAV